MRTLIIKMAFTAIFAIETCATATTSSDVAVEVEPGVWALVAGDADGDGMIGVLDADLHADQDGESGYHRSDFNLDGTVDASDLALLTANAGSVSGASSPSTPLHPALIITPERKTLMTGETLTLTAAGLFNAVNRGFAENASGATLTNQSPSSILYTAGSTSSGVDIVQAWEGNMLGRSYVNVISEEDSLKAGKAIIVAGHKSLDDPLWPVTDYLANHAYNTLLYRGFDKNNTRYLNPVTNQDVDGNGAIDDIAGQTTLAEMANTFTNWAATNPDHIFIYLVDHGGTLSGEGYFRLNKSEKLPATELDAWLDGIQNQNSNDVTLVIDCCESGSFLAPLAHAGPGKRTVITSCATNEPTYFIAGGQVSFSDAFFSGIFMGLDMEDSFALARDAMGNYQSSWIDGDGDGVYDEGIDPALVANQYLGPTFVAGKDIPQIGHVQGNQLLYGESYATLWAYNIISEYPIERVWCAVVPPGHEPDPDDPVADLPLLDLAYNQNTGRYEARYTGFNDEGIYKLMFYAQDIWGSVSTPKQSYVTQSDYSEGIIIVAGGETNSPEWNSVNNMALQAHSSILARHFDSNTIHYLCADLGVDADGDGSSDVDDLPSLSTLQHAITNWAHLDKLTLYITSEQYDNGCKLNASEFLTVTELDTWLDTFQASNQSANVILDFDQCGAFVPGLVPPPGSERIVIASTGSSSAAMRDPDGLLSFSQCFFSHIFEGNTIGDAYISARQSIRLASGSLRQSTLMDDNGDGFSSKYDGDIAEERYIGAAFVTGDDVPFIGTAMPDTALTTSNLALWVSDVSDVDGVSNVWCLITPPDYDGTNEIVELELSESTTPGHYETAYSNFSLRGTYTLTFFAMDNSGEVSAPAQAVVVLMDQFEEDDSQAQATIFTISDNQQHNFHSATDEDWIKFYAPTGLVFNIDATQQGTNIDLRLDLYYEQPEGSLEFVDSLDDFGTGSNETESLILDLTANPFGLLSGIYYVRVSSADTNFFGSGSEYDLQIYVPVGGSGGIILLNGDGGGLFDIGNFYVSLGPSEALAAGGGWRVMELTNQTYYSDTATYGLPVPTAPATYHLSFLPIPGFLAPANRELSLKADQITSVMTYYTYTNLAPRAISATAGTDDVFRITYLGYAGQYYAIEESTNLVDGGWVPLGTNQVPLNGLMHFSITNAPSKPHGFYRAHLNE